MLGAMTSAPAWAGPPQVDGPPFRVEWTASAPSSTGVRLQRVFGDVPAGGRTGFAVSELPVAAGYRVTVIWFDRVTLTRP